MARILPHPVLRVTVQRVRRRALIRAGWFVNAGIYGLAAGYVAAGDALAFALLAIIGAVALTAILIGVEL